MSSLKKLTKQINKCLKHPENYSEEEFHTLKKKRRQFLMLNAVQTLNNVEDLDSMYNEEFDIEWDEHFDISWDENRYQLQAPEDDWVET